GDRRRVIPRRRDSEARRFTLQPLSKMTEGRPLQPPFVVRSRLSDSREQLSDSRWSAHLHPARTSTARTGRSTETSRSLRPRGQAKSSSDGGDAGSSSKSAWRAPTTQPRESFTTSRLIRSRSAASRDDRQAV